MSSPTRPASPFTWALSSCTRYFIASSPCFWALSYLRIAIWHDHSGATINKRRRGQTVVEPWPSPLFIFPSEGAFPVEREAFARARRFLSYRPAARTLALVTSVLTSVLYI